MQHHFICLPLYWLLNHHILYVLVCTPLSLALWVGACIVLYFNARCREEYCTHGWTFYSPPPPPPPQMSACLLLFIVCYCYCLFQWHFLAYNMPNKSYVLAIVYLYRGVSHSLISSCLQATASLHLHARYCYSIVYIYTPFSLKCAYFGAGQDRCYLGQHQSPPTRSTHPIHYSPITTTSPGFTHTHTQTDRQTDRQNRQTDRQTDRETERQTDYMNL